MRLEIVTIQLQADNSDYYLVGAAIILTPTASLILKRWVFDFKRAGETQKCQYRLVNPQTLEVMTRIDYMNTEHDYGHVLNGLHRVDLHEEMRRLAIGAGADIVLGQEVTEIECTDGIIKFRDGTEARMDLVIVADGIKVKVPPKTITTPH